LPIGVPGELVVQGPGVARGYWQQDELTKQRFLNNVDNLDKDLDDDKGLFLCVAFREKRVN
jgi:non-ribosomal peptide synthetase component F